MKANARLIVLGSILILGIATVVVGMTMSSKKQTADTVAHTNEILPAPSTIVSLSPSDSPSPSPSVTASATPSASRPPKPIPPSQDQSMTTLHFIANVGDQITEVKALGFNLIDTGADPGTVNALPTGVRALVWLGSLDNHDCGNPGYTFAQFMAAVDRLVGNPKVFGYFLADEPHPKDCPGTASDLRERADYIHSHDPTHRSFVVVLDGSNQCGGTYGCEYSALAPAKTHVDLIGLDPYPCNTGNTATGCSYGNIDATVKRAEGNGIPAHDIVPVFQVFGQSCANSAYYRLPKVNELRTMLSHWKALVPRPAFDYSYGWERQDSACPSLADANGSAGNPDLQAVIAQHNFS